MQLAEHRPFLKIRVQRSGMMYPRIVYLFRVNFVMLSVFFLKGCLCVGWIRRESLRQLSLSYTQMKSCRSFKVNHTEF